MEIDHTIRAHAKLSASGSAMWLNCSGSIAANAEYSEQSSGYAEEGTAAHELGEMCLRNDEIAAEYIGEVFNGYLVDDEMAHAVQQHLDYVHALMVPESILHVEERVEFTDFVPEGFGTADTVMFNPGGHLHVIDYKHGQGVEVSAVNNTQGQLYALGVYQEYGSFMDVKHITIHIVQPRKFNFSEWTIEIEDLLAFGEFVKERAAIALSPNAPRTPSEKACKWCKHKANCVELAEFTREVVSAEFDDLDKDDVPSLSDDRKAHILANRGLIESFLKAVEESVFNEIQSGKQIKGFKLVEGRSIRKWTGNAEQEIVKRLGEDAYTKKLIGIIEAQKHLGKDVVDSLTTNPGGKPVLVPESDKRKPIMSVAEEFDL